jgi:hypothetical protein
MRRHLQAIVTVLAAVAMVLAPGPLLAQASGSLLAEAPKPSMLPTIAGASLSPAVPEARNYADMVYYPIHKNLLLLGGQDAASRGVPSVWSFNPGTDTWHYVSAYAPKGAIDGAAFDSAAGKVIVHVSWLFYTTGQLVSETWSFDPVTGAWENLKPKQSPPRGLCGCGAEQMVYDDKARKVVMFGGFNLKIGQETNDTWVYDYATNLWMVMPRPADESQLPSPRNSNGLTYDSRADRIILFGGGGIYGPATDTWAYDYNTNAWTNLQPAGLTPEGREYGYLAYDQGANKTVLFGGIGYTISSEYQLLSETWTYDFNANTWGLESPSTSPSARGWQAMAYSARAHAVVIFGGGPDRQHPTSETWLYRTDDDQWKAVA